MENKGQRVFFTMALLKTVMVFLLGLFASESLLRAQNVKDTTLLKSEVILTNTFDLGSALNNDLLSRYYFGKSIPETSLSTNLGRLKTANNVLGNFWRTELQYKHDYSKNILGLSNLAYTIDIALNSYQEIAFTKDAFALFFYGNKRFEGEKANLNNLQFNRQTFYQFKWGLFKKDRPHKMEYGFKLALNLGAFLENFNSNSAYLYTDTAGLYLQLNGQFNELMTMNKGLGNIQGVGAGVDLFFQKKESNKYCFRIELNNFGFIRWNKSSKYYSRHENSRFDGLEVSNIFRMPNPLITTTFNDSLRDYINQWSKKESFSTMIPMDVLIKYRYFFKSDWSASFLFNYRFFSVYKPFYQLGLNYHHQRYTVGLNANYGGYSKFNMGIDLGMKICSKFVLKFNSRYLGAFMPKRFSGIGGFLQLNYIL